MNKTKPRDCIAVSIGALVLCLFAAADCVAQTPAVTPTPLPARGVIRLRVRPKLGSAPKGLARKRFYLIRGGLEDNKSLIEKMSRSPVLSRECYYRNIGASEAFIKWLKDNDCESVYCREIEPKDLEGGGAVAEFQVAYARGEKEFGDRDLARKWITVNLREEFRSGFYHKRQAALRLLIKEAEGISKTKVTSAMTDRNGTAYFTDVEPGTYVISNILPAEIGVNSILWNCEIKVKPGELATERPYTLSNQKDKNVKCVGVEQALPPCEKVTERGQQ